MFGHDDGLLGRKPGSHLNKLKPTSEQVLADLKGFIPDKTLHQLENKYERDVQDQAHPLIGCLPNKDLCALPNKGLSVLPVGRKSHTLQRPYSAAPPCGHRKHDSVESELGYLSDSDSQSSEDEIDHYFNLKNKTKKRSGLLLGPFIPRPPPYPIPPNTLSNAVKVRRSRISEFMPFGRRLIQPDIKTKTPRYARRGKHPQQLPLLIDIGTLPLLHV